MKAAVLKGPGNADIFIIEERPIPSPKEGWVLVKVKAFGLNRSELMTRKGMSPGVKFPRVLGIECVGIVQDDPTGDYAKGQKVAACMGGMGRDFDGGYSEYALIPKHILYPFESDLPWEVLGAMPEMFQTVYGSLHTSLKIRSGETLLIRGGTSSIGLLSAQMAKLHGLKIIATTRDKENAALLLSNGADEIVIDEGAISTAVKSLIPAGVDKILDLIGTSTLKDSLQCAAQGGAVCMTGMLSEKWSFADFAPMEVIPATVNLTVYDSGQVRSDRESFQSFVTAVEQGKIKLKLSKTFELFEVSAAHALMESNGALGKIVVLANK